MPRFLLDVALPVPLAETFTYGCTVDAAGRLPRTGDLVRAPFGRRRGVIGLVVAVRDDPAHLLEIAGRTLRDVQALLPEEYHLGDDRLALARWIASYYAVPLGEVVPLFHPPSPGTKGRRTATAPEVFPLDEAASVTLTAAQSVVVDLAQDVLARGEFAAVLVHGVTGSGKTEVFLRAIEASLARAAAPSTCCPRSPSRRRPSRASPPASATASPRCTAASPPASAAACTRRLPAARSRWWSARVRRSSRRCATSA